MLLSEREIDIPAGDGNDSLLAYFEQAIREHLSTDEIPVRFSVTRSCRDGYHCE